MSDEPTLTRQQVRDVDRRAIEEGGGSAKITSIPGGGGTASVERFIDEGILEDIGDGYVRRAASSQKALQALAERRAAGRVEDDAADAAAPSRDEFGVVDQTDQGPQAVIPGAEKISDKELVERGKAAQKPADDGLFDVGGRGQEDLFRTPEGQTELFNFGSLAAIQKQWQLQVADPILNRLNFYPFKDITLGTMEQQKEYLDLRGLLKGHIYKTNVPINKLARILRKGGANDTTAAFDYLTTEGADPSTLPVKIRGAAIASKSAIKKLTKELVRRGIISQESADKHEDAYLPRMYLKFLLERTDFGSGLKLSPKNYAKYRNDELPEDLRDVYYGEIKDVPFLITQALSVPASDLAKQDFMRDLSQNPAWVLETSLVDWTPPGLGAKWAPAARTESHRAEKARHTRTINKLKAEGRKHLARAARLKKQGRINEMNKARKAAGLVKKAIADYKSSEAAKAQQSGIQRRVPGVTRKVTPFWLKAEATALRNRASMMPDENHQKRAREVAAQMDEVADQALGDRGGVPKDFREMPNSARYGDMRGLVVRKEIYNDLVGQSGFWIGEKDLYDKIGDVATTVNAVWKTMKVPMNPPTQVRNLISNGVLLDISGVPFQKLPRYYIRSFVELVRGTLVDASPETKAKFAKIGVTPKRGTFFRMAIRNGIPASNFAAEELFKIYPDIIRVKGAKGGVAGVLAKIGEPLARLAQKPGDLYQFSETLGKMVKLMDMIEREGASEIDAVAAAQKALFDYSLVPQIVRRLRRVPIGVPFITFYYKAFPEVLQASIRRPGKFVKYYAIPYLLGAALAATLHGVDDEDIEALRMALPEWLRAKGHTYIFPYKDASGRWAFVDFGYYLPWAVHEQSMRNLLDLAGGDIESVDALMNQLGILGGPVPEAITASKTGRDAFRDQDIYRDTDPGREKVYKLFMYMWRMIGPSWLTDQGVTGHLYRSINQIPNYYGDPPLSVPQALGRGVGLNIYPVDPVTSRDRNIRRKKFRIRDQVRALRGALRNQALDPRERGDVLKEHHAIIESLVDDLKLYQDQSKLHPNLTRRRPLVVDIPAPP